MLNVKSSEPGIGTSVRSVQQLLVTTQQSTLVDKVRRTRVPISRYSVDHSGLLRVYSVLKTVEGVLLIWISVA